MLKCPHCQKEIEEKDVRKYLAYKLVDASRKKFGDEYSKEMRRRVNKRWEKKHVDDTVHKQ